MFISVITRPIFGLRGEEKCNSCHGCINGVGIHDLETGNTFHPRCIKFEKNKNRANRAIRGALMEAVKRTGGETE